MEPSEIEMVTSRMAGYLDALASTTKELRDYQGNAFCEKLDVGNIESSIAEFYFQSCEALRNEFPDIDVAPYVFEKAEVINSWIRKLHMELEERLLPKPIQDLFSDASTIKAIKYNVAWQVMEMIRIVSEDFESDMIFKINYREDLVSCGVVFVIPLKDTCLLLRFGWPADA